MRCITMLTPSEQIRMLLIKQKMTIGALADRLGQSRQNLSNKLSRDNFSVLELQQIASVCGVEYESFFVLPDGTKI